jgi:hypothetical protein
MSGREEMDTAHVFTLRDFIMQQLALSSTSWSIGVLGALAEFHRGESEPWAQSDTCVVTSRGAIRLEIAPATRAIAYELVTQNIDSWNHGVALCLPEGMSRMHARCVITELGPDREAIRPQDRGAILFDLGLASPACDFGVRTADRRRIEQLRAAAGTSLFDPRHDLLHDIPRWSPHRVFISRLGRVEVYQRIGAAGGVTPEGPHTHLLQKLLRTNRTHSANLGLPDGLVPCVTLYPANPVRDEHGHARPFDAADHAAFQEMLERFGAAGTVETKRNVWTAVRNGKTPASLPIASRIQRSACRIALRQMLYTDGMSPALAAWRAAYEPALRVRAVCASQISGAAQ